MNPRSRPPRTQNAVEIHSFPSVTSTSSIVQQFLRHNARFFTGVHIPYTVCRCKGDGSMPVTDYYQIVKMTMPSSWIAIILAFISAYLVIRFRYGKKEAELVSDELILILLIWKLSVLITDFQTVRESLWALLYFNGGTVGFLLGIVAVAIKLLVNWKRNRLTPVQWSAFFATMIVAQSVYQLAMVMLNDGELAAQWITGLLFLLLPVIYLWKGAADADVRPWAILVIAVHIFAAAVQPNGFTSTPFWLASSISVYFLFIGTLSIRNGIEKEEEN